MSINNWPRWIALLSILALAALPIACSGSGGGGNDGGGDDGEADGTDGGDDVQTKQVLKFGLPMTVDPDEAGMQLDLAATPDGQFAIAYYKLGEDRPACGGPGDCPQPAPQSAEWSCENAECVAMCTEPILGDDQVPVEFDWVRYAWFDGTAWNHEDVTSFSSVLLSGIDLAFDGNTPMVVFLGGAGGLQVCGGTDVEVGRRTGPGTWNLTAAVSTSGEAAEGDDCPRGQGICDFGDVVGLWPSVAIAPDGTIGIAYRDIHNGYTKEAQDSSDLEWTWSAPGGGSWGHQWVDLGRGSGLFNSLAFGPDNTPAVAFYNGKHGVLTFDRQVDGAFNGSVICASDADCPEGLTCIQSTQFCWNVIARPEQAMDNESVSLAIGPDGRYLVAYFDPDTKNLMLAHSTDGLQWTQGIIDSDGSTGLYPTLMFNPVTGLPAVSYYRCSNYDPGPLNCNQNQDGPRMAVFSGTYPDELTQQVKWKKNQDLIDQSDGVATDGQHIRAAFLPDGRVGLAYSYSWIDPVTIESRRSLMFRLGTWEDEQ